MAYGKIIPGLILEGEPAPYGVINERAVRAGAGLMFAIGFFTLMTMYFERNLLLAFWVILVFWIDFILKVFIGPEISLFGRIGKLLVKNQRPEYVGAIQKRFAWSIGLVMSSAVLGFISYQLFFATQCTQTVVGSGSNCIIPMILCGICLIFMWLESAVGFCVGCVIYQWLVKRGVIKQKEFSPVCPGGVCSVEK
ncbi:MAG: DUF4395 domain-containing protein [Candidatus Moraniibacteriota bacterium]|nr:MAG: DUF4395 domain-containing protein [Candidatus Moranbacteria bacterium]